MIIIGSLSTLVYSNTFKNGFHFDDFHHIYNNPYIKSLYNIPLFFVDTETFSTHGGWHYRPLIMTSHAINYYFSRLNPAGFHVGNLILHVTTAFLVFLVVDAILGKTFFIALAAAMIFAVHPFNSEAVNYITARSSILASIFYLLSFYLWIKYREIKTSVYYFLSIFTFFLGMLTKEILITLPIILWLYDIYFLKPDSQTVKPSYKTISSFTKSVLLYIPYILVIASYILLRHLLVGAVISSEKLERGYLENLLMSAKVLVKYIYLLFLPLNLAVEHAISEVISFFDWGLYLSVIILLAVLIIASYLYKNRNKEWKAVSFFILWFFITMLPTTIIPLSAPLQENRGYIAGIAFAVFLGTVINKAASKSRHSISIMGVILLILIIIYSYGTMNRNSVWIDEFSLWLDAVKKSPSAWRAHSNLANSYQKLGNLDLAIEEYKKTDNLKKNYTPTINRLGLIYLQQGKLDLALNVFKRAIQIKPDDIESHANIAKVYLKTEQMELAKKECIFVVNQGRNKAITSKEYEYVHEAIECTKFFMERERGDKTIK